MPEYTAEFNRVKDAKAFHDRLASEPGAWYAKDIVHSGRTVTWDLDFGAKLAAALKSGLFNSDDEIRRFYEQSMRESVGYYGSTVSRRARLNGVACPISY